MNILIHITRYKPAILPAPDFFCDQVFPLMVSAAGSHHLSFLFEGSDRPVVQLGDRDIHTNEGHAVKGFFPRLWFKYITLPRLLKELHTDQVLSINGSIRSNGTRQVTWNQDQDDGPSCLRPPLPGFTPAGWNIQQETRDTLTSGKNYFLYAGRLDKGIMDLVKAFSMFKKRQKSDWKLVLAGSAAPGDAFMKSLEHYRYKDDLVIFDKVGWTDLQRLLPAAYALVYPADPATLLLLPEAFNSGVPVLVLPTDAMKKAGSDAVLYIEGEGQTGIAETMMTIYKDESLRARLVAAGREKINGRSWAATAAAFIALAVGEAVTLDNGNHN